MWPADNETRDYIGRLHEELTNFSARLDTEYAAMFGVSEGRLADEVRYTTIEYPPNVGQTETCLPHVATILRANQLHTGTRGAYGGLLAIDRPAATWPTAATEG